MKKRELVAGYEISPVIKGGWQLSSGHSLNLEIQEQAAISDMIAFIKAGITTFDFGDIYTGVEELVGKTLVELSKEIGASAREKVQLHTKYVPNETFLKDFDSSDTINIVNRSLTRLGVDQVDLVQLHWWRYEDRHYLAAMEALFGLKELGKIRNVGITNFDLTRLEEMVNAGLKPASHQIQYSMLDRRAEQGMSQFCEENQIGILCYGTVAGGFFSEKFLGASEPTEVETRSNVKYQIIIDEFGGWELFQTLLRVCKSIADSHETDIGTIASAWVLARPAVKGVIVGARNISHIDSNVKIPQIIFTSQELEAIDEVLSKSKGPTGPVYDLERYSEKHRKIMHTNNN
jgi:aryl-alcohol dehydrogenase-like predicted oxidoreductase